MNKEDYPKDHLNYILFYGEKNTDNDWYILNEKEEKIWNTEKVTDFWAKLRAEKMAKEDYDFSNFIFPEFGEDFFWKKGAENVFAKDVNFFGAIFSGRAYFSYASFSDKAHFGNASFSDKAHFEDTSFSDEADFSYASFSEAYFENASFSDQADFGNAFFGDKTDFYEASFGDKADFEDVSFSGRTSFEHASFSDQADFGNASFTGGASFYSTIFEGQVNFGFTTFDSKVYFAHVNFNKGLKFNGVSCTNKSLILFENSIFSEKYIANFKNITFPLKNICQPLVFENIDFNDNVIFNRCNLSYFIFNDCDLTNVRLVNWIISKKKGIYRLILGNEINLNNIIINAKEDRLEYFISLASLYRLLKVNCINTRDWNAAGDAYRSEMVMRREVIKLEIELQKRRILYVNLVIIWVHDIFSGFQQSLSRPLFWLFIVWLGFGFGFHIHDGDAIECGLQKSIYAMLILSGSLNKEDPLFGYMVLERVLGVILLTFFVLATRARLKQ